MANNKGLSGRQAIVLLSGGLDSAVTLYFAKKQGFACRCLIFDYGQRHKREIESAKKIANKAGCPSTILKIKFPWKGSGLLDRRITIPRQTGLPAGQAGARAGKPAEIPVTYVPARNIIFLSFGLSFAEAVGAKVIFIGAHIQDYSGYPDCRKEFFQAFGNVIKTGTRSGVQASRINIWTPLIAKRKSQIIKLGVILGVPFKLTWSCYRGGKKPCGKCDSCYFRARGFSEAGVSDPLLK